MWDRNGLPTLISTGTDNYVHAAGIARSNDDWLLADAVGSVRAVTDGTGASIGSQDFTVYVRDLENCLANFKTFPQACEGLPDDLLDILARFDRGDGRDSDGRFTGEGGYGEEYETQGLDRYEAETGSIVVRQRIRVTLPDGTIRYYDGLALKPDGTYEGIEVKGGSATLTPGQRTFDSQVESGEVATGRLNGIEIQVTSVVLRNA